MTATNWKCLGLTMMDWASLRCGIKMLKPLCRRAAGQRVQVTNFSLDLGALIEAVVPQPVVRLADGSLVQNRNEIVVYFNEDPLFVEDDSAMGTVTSGSAQDPGDRCPDRAFL